jgi:hypothetical protein
MKLLTPKTQAFDTWIRDDFVQHNDELETLTPCATFKVSDILKKA